VDPRAATHSSMRIMVLQFVLMFSLGGADLAVQGWMPCASEALSLLQASASLLEGDLSLDTRTMAIKPSEKIATRKKEDQHKHANAGKFPPNATVDGDVDAEHLPFHRWRVLDTLHRFINESDEEGMDFVFFNDSRGFESLTEKIRNLAAIAMVTPDMNSSVYRSIRAVYRKVASGIDPSLDELNLLLEAAAWSQSANTFAKNRALLTASDLALFTGVGLQEDLGSRNVPNMTKAFQGDMLPEAEGQLLLFQNVWNNKGIGHLQYAGQPWTGGEVNYCFSPDVSERVRRLFTAATTTYMHAVPCLSFADVGWKSGTSSDLPLMQACQKSPAIFVTSLKTAGCYSYVGMTTMRSQQLQLNDPGCMLIGTVMHQIGHALGMGHEQSRSDRNSHVMIHWDNIAKDSRDSFAIGSSYTGMPYDFLSLMHFDAHSFAVDTTLVSLERSDSGGYWQLGQRVGLSQSDVFEVTSMYLDEVKSCSGSSLQGVGCSDRPSLDRKASCDERDSCEGSFASDCCGCGGGVRVQCFKGLGCPHAQSTTSHAARVLLVFAILFFTCCLYTARKQT